MKNIFKAVLAMSSLPCVMLSETVCAEGTPVPNQQHGKSIMDEIVVSASPLEEKAAGINQATNVLAGEMLHKEAAATIGDTLKNLQGVTNSSFGPGVGQPVIRGQSGNRVRVLQDSMGSLDASAASGDHTVTVEALVAERIEVLRGPATLRYGNGAIGGVVNVIDNRVPDELPDEFKSAVEYRHNSANDQDSTVFVMDGAIKDTTLGNWAWHLDGIYRDSNDLEIDGLAQLPEGDEEDHESTHGFIGNTDTQSHTVTGGLSWIGDKGFIGISVSEMENKYGIPAGGHHHEDEHEEEEAEIIRIDMEQTRVDLKSEWQDILPGIELGRFRLSYNDYEHIELEGGEKGTLFTNEAFEGRVELLHQEVAGWTGAIGLQMEDRQFAAIGEESFIPKSDIQNTGIFWVGETNHGDWSYELGLRLDRQTIDPDNDSEIDHNTQSLSFGTLWQMTDEQSVSFTLTRAQRAPSIEELLSNGPHHASQSFDLGDDNLDEETSHNLEFGYRYEGPINLSLNLFYNSIDDFIFKRNTGEENHEEELAIFQYEQEDATFRGAEASIEIPVASNWNVEFFGDYVRAKLDNNGDVPRIPPLRYGISLDYSSSSQWNAGMRLTEVAKQNHAGEFEEDTDEYTRLDAHLHYHMNVAGSDWLLFVKGNNLLDEDIRNSTSFLRESAPESGQSLEVGIRISFN
jgi:iron complex outermembrane recepter protein